ncbi:MAG: hypothetical protein ACPHIC_01140 [Acidimicrobiales bacterium]
MSFTVDPQPSEEEMAAILAAYEILWPRPSAAVCPDPAGRWRFASRSWGLRPAYGGWR